MLKNFGVKKVLKNRVKNIRVKKLKKNCVKKYKNAVLQNNPPSLPASNGRRVLAQTQKLLGKIDIENSISI